MADKPSSVKIEDARIIFRNFAGGPTPFNKVGGERTFAVVIPLETAEQMLADGWNIKIRDPRDEGDEPFAYLTVKVSYENKPPRVLVVTSAGQKSWNEEMISSLDYADIRTIDVIINPYAWEINGKTGISAYLKTLVVVLDEDELEMKYKVYENEKASVPTGPVTEG